MNKSALRSHLKEAAEQLADTLKNLDASDYDEDDLRVDLGHAYHHINSAWNGRDCTEKEYKECSDANFSRWRKFPTEDEMLLVSLVDDSHQPKKNGA